MPKEVNIQSNPVDHQAYRFLPSTSGPFRGSSIGCHRKSSYVRIANEPERFDQSTYSGRRCNSNETDLIWKILYRRAS